MKPETTAYVFPGQGSQAVGLGLDLAEAYPIAKETYQQADHILGFPLSQIAWQGPEDLLTDTVNTQPALLVHSVASLRVLQETLPDLHPAYVAGHSMGEISALVAAEALSFEDALRLARIRGELMKRAGEQTPGGMAAILGLDIPTLDQICRQASQQDEIVQVANDNCPSQVVISGTSAALDRAILLAQQAGARRAIRLPISIASHSPLMQNAQSDFNAAVDATPMRTPKYPIIGNVTASPLDSAEAIRNDLQAQLTNRVRWTESIGFLLQQGATHFVELGSGSVLTGLIKRIDRQAVGITLGHPQDFTSLA